MPVRADADPAQHRGDTHGLTVGAQDFEEPAFSARAGSIRNHLKMVFGDRSGTKQADRLADELIELLSATVETALRHAAVPSVVPLSGNVRERKVEPKRQHRHVQRKCEHHEPARPYIARR